MIKFDIRMTPALALSVAIAACSSSGTATSGAAAPAGESPRIVQPGAPGEAGRTFSAAELARWGAAETAKRLDELR